MTKRITKKVKSSKDLNKFALREGAEIKSQNGKVFNAGGEKLDRKPLVRSTPKKPEKPSMDAELLASTAEKVASDNRKVLTEIKNQIAAIKFEAAEPPMEWVFDIIRNDDEAMSIKQIRAKAIFPKRTLN